MRETIYNLLQLIDELEDACGPAGGAIVDEVAEELGLDMEYLRETYNGDYQHKPF